MSKQPVIALVGRPNVGKSTLFNRLTRSRDALVANIPGLTRDRQYGIGTHEERSFIVVDTGGLSGEIEGIDSAMAEQTKAAVAEADIVLLLVDGRAGMTSGDAAISQELREQGKAICLVVNKTDGLDPAVASSEFYALGIEKLASISASHGRGVNTLLAMLFAELPEEEIKESADQDERIKVAIIGRPNVGKSTLVNRLLGEERVVVFDYPGTTRDSIFVPFERDGSSYTLIDTAGLRRRARVSETVEKFSVVKALQALHEAHVVVVVLDARQGISVQDASLLGLVVESGRGVVIAINKWDNLSRDEKDEARTGLSRKLDFIDYADRHFISALHGTGVGNLLDSINNAFKSAMSTHVTSRLTRILEDAVSAHQPPMVGSGRIKLRYAHQGGKNPPLVVIHGSRVDKVPAAYSRYLSNTYRKVLKLAGTPLRIEFRASENPYQDKRNKLTPRQERSRKRLIRHVKRKR